ncbi:MAG: GNAT family N-acetyltransferase [Anaerolineae bacterium]
MANTYRSGDGWRIVEYEDGLADGVARMLRASDESWPGGLRGSAALTAESVRRMQQEVRRLATFIAIADGQVAGMCTLEERSDREDTAWVAFLNVAPAFQGRRLGREMLRESVAVATEKGFARLAFGTWPGNLKAVPLYKKTGFFWRPATTVLMENYIPLLLRLPLLRDFLSGRDWYDCLERELKQQEDEVSEGGVAVYPYVFRVGGQRLRLLVDRERGAVCGYEHPDFAITPELGGAEAPFGQAKPVAWRLCNRRSEPVHVAIAISGEPGIAASLSESFLLEGERLLEQTVVVSEGASRPDPERQPATGLTGHTVVGRALLPLALGLRPVPPFELRPVPAHVSLVPGVAGHVHVNIRSHVDVTVELHLGLAGSEGLRLEGGPAAVAVAAQATSGFSLLAMAPQAGLHSLVVRVQAADDSTLAWQQVLHLPCVGAGDLLAYRNAEETVLESEATRVVLRERGGGLSIRDRLSDRQYLAGADTPGPTYRPRDLDRADYHWQTRREGGAIVAWADVRAERIPALVCTPEVALLADGTVERRFAVRNLGPAAVEATVLQSGWAQDLRAMALPLVGGLVYDSSPSFRQLTEDAELTSASFKESWLALELQHGYVAGLVWEQPVEHPHHSQVIAKLGTVPAGGSARSGRLWHICRRGSWRDVRQAWRRLVAPEAAEEGGEPAPGLALRLRPATAFATRGEVGVALEVASADSMPVRGEARLEPPAGWQARPRQWQVKIGPNSRFFAATTVTAPSGEPQAGEFRLTFDTPADRRHFAHTLYVAGADGTVAVQAFGVEGREALRLDNGYFGATIVPAYGGSIVALERGGHNHVFGTFPTPRAFLWMNDWYGGIRPAAYVAFPDRTMTESFAAAEIEVGRDAGPHWRGLRLTATLAQEGLKGFLLHADYLTLPGSNILALRATLQNPCGARVVPTLGFECNLRPAGKPGATMHYRRDGEERIVRGSESMLGVSAGDWAAAEEAGGGCVAAIAGRGCEGVSATVMDGETVQVAPHRRSAPVEGGATVSLVGYLVLAADLAQARLYRGLAGLDLQG